MKKLYLVIGFLFLLAVTPEAIATVTGDADNDGKVGVSDAIYALQAAVNMTTPASTYVDTWKLFKVVEVENDPDQRWDWITCFSYSNGILSKTLEYNRDRTTSQILMFGDTVTDYISDAKGRILYSRDLDDHQLNLVEYEYDENGKLIGMHEDEGYDGTIDYYSTLIYNAAGQVTRVNNYDSDGTLEEYGIALYDGEQLNRYEEYDAGNNLQEYCVYSYAADGRMTQETVYDAENNLLDTSYITCKKIAAPANGLNDYIYQLLLW